MKRLGSSDSMGALMAICPTEGQSPRNNHVYSREFQSILDNLEAEGCVEEAGHVFEKKRRLGVDQVKALEKNFEVENKLEPDRKVKLAQELGLQPRQVAVWFQNRRARGKTKQLERDYGVLKGNYDALKLNYDTLQRDNEALLKEIKEMKSKLQEENTVSNLSVKEEIALTVESDKEKLIEKRDPLDETPIQYGSSESKDLNYECLNSGANGSLFPADFKDGTSDSDSSAIVNEDSSSIPAISSSEVLQSHRLLMSPASSSLKFNCSSSSSPSSINCFQFQKNSYQAQQYGKLEEHNFFSAEEACSFFSDEQAPTLQWNSSDQWN